jgi:hypothetical protein
MLNSNSQNETALQAMVHSFANFVAGLESLGVTQVDAIQMALGYLPQKSFNYSLAETKCAPMPETTVPANLAESVGTKSWYVNDRLAGISPPVKSRQIEVLRSQITPNSYLDLNWVIQNEAGTTQYKVIGFDENSVILEQTACIKNTDVNANLSN